ncbi:hypothetical protein HELRODRAFT_190830 [Helobdella robusta]|uniref:Uncharacterized protein n=1 Tax=Helobdella robusta TaxID=6412 RepID=T1FSC0_HELRO|nr:hypothetical protein HELRODRAFT_190830 [Helobdella robusta]ESO07977.1 hypothetical protein HELRODRAFT_190830 [Helobdella robusta]
MEIHVALNFHDASFSGVEPALSRNVHTGVNFIEKSECSYTVRFIRITYVRPSEDLAELLHSLYSPPTSLTYKTFVPPPVKVAMCSGAPEYENFGVTWERAKVWLRSVDRRIVSVETFYHPLHKVWHGQDGGETSVVMGEWTSNKRDRKRTAERKKLVNIVRRKEKEEEEEEEEEEKEEKEGKVEEEEEEEISPEMIIIITIIKQL